MDDVELWVEATLRQAGIDVSSEELAIVRLIHATLFGQLGILDQVDIAEFPFEPVDPSRAPGPA